MQHGIAARSSSSGGTVRAILVAAAALAMALSSDPAGAAPRTSPLVIDHTCTDIQSIPPAWIDSIQAKVFFHYAHTSYGEQLTIGMQRLESSDPAYDINIGFRTLPVDPDALCTFDGQETVTYVTPAEYYETAAGMNMTRAVLSNNPTVNASLFTWCTQMNGYTQAQVQAYLDSMSALEREFPDVTFVYATGNAQRTGADGYYRYMNNEMIRQYCIANNKVLYDFEDLDCWYLNPATSQWEHSTYDDGQGHIVPYEHPVFSGSDGGHASYASCDQKGRSVWWMVARLAGWSAASGAESAALGAPVRCWSFPNPFNPCARVAFTLPREQEVRVSVYDVRGALVKSLFEGQGARGLNELVWNGADAAGRPCGSGMYLCRVTCEQGSYTSKMILVR